MLFFWNCYDVHKFYICLGAAHFLMTLQHRYMNVTNLDPISFSMVRRVWGPKMEGEGLVLFIM